MIGKPHQAGLKSGHPSISDVASIGLSFLARATSEKAGKGNKLLHPPSASPGRATPGITVFRVCSPDLRTEGRSVTERSRMRAGMTALQRMAAVTMMAGLLTGPAAPPDRPSDRPRYRFYLWHLFMDWLGYRRARRTKPAGGREASGEPGR